MVQTSILCNLIYQWGYRIIYVYYIYLLVIETGLKNNGKWIFYKILTKNYILINMQKYANELISINIYHDKSAENDISYDIEIIHLLMGMIEWILVANLKWIWWELHRNFDLIRNLNTEWCASHTNTSSFRWAKNGTNINLVQFNISVRI